MSGDISRQKLVEMHNDQVNSGSTGTDLEEKYNQDGLKQNEEEY